MGILAANELSLTIHFQLIVTDDQTKSKEDNPELSLQRRLIDRLLENRELLDRFVKEMFFLHLEDLDRDEWKEMILRDIPADQFQDEVILTQAAQSLSPTDQEAVARIVSSQEFVEMIEPLLDSFQLTLKGADYEVKS